MKRIIAYLFLSLFTMLTASAQCELIDETISLACQKVNRGNVKGAWSALRTTQGFSDLRSCSNYSCLADEIRRIESRQQSSSSGSSSPSVGQDLTITANGVTFTMVAVRGGTFQMGATPEQGSEILDHENPVHHVTLSDYYIGQTEVTQALWQAVMGSNPSNFKGDNLPVETVSWNNCQQFITRLNQITGRRFRLPTEAEWEYAARGGNKSRGYKYAGSDDIGSVAWYSGNSGDSPFSGDWDWDRIMANHCRTHPVGQKQANELGIYDMAGNVWEWCQDWYASDYYGKSPSNNPCNSTKAFLRVGRGGSWNIIDNVCRVSYRFAWANDFLGETLGFRLAL